VVDPNKWIDFVVHVRIDYRQKGDGIAEVWVNGDKALDYKGQIGYNDQGKPYVKFGNYAAYLKRKKGVERVVVYDNFRMIKGDGSYEKLDPKCRASAPENRKGAVGVNPPSSLKIEVVR
jgi:hypothetical protein